MEEITVIPLGTVSPYPKGNHNCPGFLIKYNGANLLLDCGSGITRLLNMPDDLKNLSIIISHNHLDHHSDISSIAYASYVYHKLGLLEEKVKVFSKHAYLSYLSNTHYFKFTNIIKDFNIEFLENIHDTPCYSTKITTKEGIQIVYTADTGYNEKLIDFAKDVDLLICESTFLKGQVGSKNHLYAYEAGKIAREANVKKLMLTHFWPEIPKSKYVKEAQELFENVIAADEGQSLILRRN